MEAGILGSELDAMCQVLRTPQVAGYVYIYRYIYIYGLTPDSRPGARLRVKDHKYIIDNKGAHGKAKKP